MTFKWSFPIDTTYRNEGINASEIDNKDSPIQTFVREICQNSNDYPFKRPVRIEFSKFKLETDEFPDVDGLREIMGHCLKEVSKITKNDTALKKYQSRISSLEKPTIVMMRISDFGTKGLEGSDTIDSTTPWNSLTLGRGISNKDGNAGGSKGRGKDSFYRMSKIGTVFFSTKAIDGFEASVGCSNQITYHDFDGQKHNGFGCYFDEYQMHSADQLHIDPLFHRDECGTDIFISAFDESENDDYQMKMAIIRDFFVSIIDKNLVAIVNGTVINESTIYSVLDGLEPPESDMETVANLMELISCYREGAKYSCDDYEIFIAKSDKFYRVASVRAGMTISREFHKMPHDNYIGLVVVRSKKASELLLKSEDISHNSWKPDVADFADRKSINDLIIDMKNHIRIIVNDLVDQEVGDRKEAMGLNRYIPVVNDTVTSDVAKKEFLYDPITKIKMTKKKTPVPKHPLGDTSIVLPTASVDDEVEYPNGPVNVNDEPRPAAESNRDVDMPGMNEDFKRAFKERSVKLEALRSFCIDSDSKKYKMMFDTKEQSKFYVDVHVMLYDHDTGEKISILDAHDADGSPISVENNRIGPIIGGKSSRYMINFTLDYPIACRITAVALKKGGEIQ